jgi:hypothetical protein
MITYKLDEDANYEKLGFKNVYTRSNNPKGYNSYTMILAL